MGAFACDLCLVAERQIVTIMCAAPLCTCYVGGGHYPCYDGAVPNQELLEVRRTKISLDHAGAGYGYPAIRLPFTCLGIVGLSMRICHTVHNGAGLLGCCLFKNGPHKRENVFSSAKSPMLTLRRSPVRSRPSPSFFLQSVTLKLSVEAFSDRTIMVKKKHNKDKKVHN